MDSVVHCNIVAMWPLYPQDRFTLISTSEPKEGKGNRKNNALTAYESKKPMRLTSVNCMSLIHSFQTLQSFFKQDSLLVISHQVTFAAFKKGAPVKCVSVLCIH